MNSEVRIRLKDHQQSQHQNKQNQHQHKHDQNQPVYNQHHQQHHQNQHQHKRKQNQPEYNRVPKVTTASGVSSLSLALPPASLDLLDQFAMTTANLSAHAQYEVRLKSSNNLNAFITLFSNDSFTNKVAKKYFSPALCRSPHLQKIHLLLTRICIGNLEDPYSCAELGQGRGLANVWQILLLLFQHFKK